MICCLRKFLSTFLTVFVFCSLAVLAADVFNGKCVAVTDGDTVGVLRDGKEVRIRLDGIDCPESNQDFGTRAKQFTSSIVFGKEVQVTVKDVDRYGRLVCRIVCDGKDLSLELVKAGLAWHYKQYSSDSVLAAAEDAARELKRGLWSIPNPVAPWDFRHGKPRQYSGGQALTADSNSRKADSGLIQDTTVYITNTGTKYHAASCRYLARSQIPISLSEAMRRGYKPCSVCGGGA